MSHYNGCLKLKLYNIFIILFIILLKFNYHNTIIGTLPIYYLYNVLLMLLTFIWIVTVEWCK